MTNHVVMSERMLVREHCGVVGLERKNAGDICISSSLIVLRTIIMFNKISSWLSRLVISLFLLCAAVIKILLIKLPQNVLFLHFY